MLTLIDPNHECGRYWYDEDADISVFEDTQDGVRCYGWRGTLAQHDRAVHTSQYPTVNEAADAADHTPTA